MIQCQVRKLSTDAKLPEYATDGSGCFDIYAYIDKTKAVRTTRIFSGDSEKFHTGLAFEVPEGYVMLVYSRSGHGFKQNVRLANCVAVIDSDYRGELMISLTKDQITSDRLAAMDVSHGVAIAQGMIIPIPKVEFLEVNELSETVRGESGFGSTDKEAKEQEHAHANFTWGLTPDQQCDKDYPLGDDK